MRQSTLAILLGLIACAPHAAAQPGYRGTMPSPQGRRALDNLVAHGEFAEIPLLFGGRAFEVDPLAVTLHPLGPARADVLELVSARTTGPHVVLRRGKLGIFVPTRCDADIRELHALLGLDPPAGLDGEPSEWFERAVAAVAGLGTAVDGVRVGLVRRDRTETMLRFELTIWNTGSEAVEWIGTASLHTDGRRVPIGFQTPRLKPPEGGFRFRLGPASSMTVPLEIPATATDEDRGPSRIPADDGRAVVQLRVDRGDRDAATASTATLPAPPRQPR